VVAGLATWKMLVVYVLATLAGGAAAGLVFRTLNPDDAQELKLPRPRVSALRSGASRK
jgi:hypothetical protein